MLSNSSSADSDEGEGSIMASPFVPAIVSAARRPRSRLVRIGSTDSASGQQFNNYISRSNSPGTSSRQAPDFSPVLSGSFSEAAAIATPSLLLPPSQGLAERAGGSLRTPQQQQQHQEQQLYSLHQPRHAEEEAFLNALAGLKVQQTPTTAAPGDGASFKREPRGAAPASRRSPGRHAPPSERLRASQSTSITGGGSRPASPLRPGSGHSAFHATHTSAAFGGTLTGKRTSEATRRLTSPTKTTTATAAASTAVLFPTSEWIRTALNNAGSAERGGRGIDGDGRDGRDATARAPSQATTTLTSPTGQTTGAGGQAPQRDTAMRLHEQRVKAAMRSQDEMRDFSVILRRLEEDGALVLREQRRRRQERHGGQRGGSLMGRSRRRARGARGKATATSGAGAAASSSVGRSPRRLSGNSESGVQSSKGGDDNVSEGFSDFTDVDEDEPSGDESGGGFITADANATSGAGQSAAANLGASARAVAEMQGAENMSRVALYKLRDRTAREWVVLQRRRLEQRRAGPAALHRHLHASTARLQATRTGGSEWQGQDSQPLQITSSSSTAVVMPAKWKAGAEAESTALPSLHNGSPSLHPLAGSSLAISWGERDASATPLDAGEKNQTKEVDCEAQPRTDDACSLILAAAATSQSPISPHAGHERVSAEAATPTSAGVSTMNSPPTASRKDAAHAVTLLSPLPVDSANVSAQPQSITVPSTNTATLVTSPAHAAGDLATSTTAAVASSIAEDEMLRRELQRLLSQANECSLYGLDQCLNSKARTTTQQQKPLRGTRRAPPASSAQQSAKGSRSASKGNVSAEALHQTPGEASAQRVPQQVVPIWTPPPPRVISDHRGPSLPMPLHRQFGQHSGSRTGSMRTSIGAGGGALIGRSHSPSKADASRTSQVSVPEENDGDSGLSLTPAKAHSLPPLGGSPGVSPLVERRSPGVNITSPSYATMDAKSSPAGKQAGASLPSVHLSRQAVAASSEASQQQQQQRPSQPPRRFASLSSRKKHQRTPLPVERGVGEHAAALLQHELLLTRRYEMEAERGNTREIDRACETLQQLLPFRQQLLDQDLQKGSTTTTTAAKAASRPPQQSTPLLMLRDSAQGPTSTPQVAAGVAGSRPGNAEPAVDRSYHPQAVLQRHRQLLYDEAVRMESCNRDAARSAYLDVLSQLARRHVSSISWPVVEEMLADARAQLRPEAGSGTPPAHAAAGAGAGGVDGEGAGDVSPSRTPHGRPKAALLPREQIQRLIATHLGVLELSQWPVQEVLQHLAALYRVPLYLLHEGIAEQQRRFAHTYNYEERFRAVDRQLVGGGGGADCVLRLTLHRCRRPPLAPSRESVAEAAPNSSTVPGSAAAAAAANAMGVPHVEPQGEALYYIRLRIGQQTIASSAVPLSSAASGPASRYGADADAAWTRDAESGAMGSAAHAAVGGGGGRASPSSTSAKVLSFMGQTLTVYIPTTSVAARKRRTMSLAGGSRAYQRASSQHSLQNGSADGAGGAAAAAAAVAVADEDDRGCVVRVELMQTGVEAPLARGEVDLEAMGLNTYGESGRIQTQTVQIALKRKGYRSAELKAALEVTS